MPRHFHVGTLHVYRARNRRGLRKSVRLPSKVLRGYSGHQHDLQFVGSLHGGR